MPYDYQIFVYMFEKDMGSNLSLIAGQSSAGNCLVTELLLSNQVQGMRFCCNNKAHSYFTFTAVLTNLKIQHILESTQARWCLFEMVKHGLMLI